MVPPGHPRPERPGLRAHRTTRPTRASLLAQAGYPGGAGFPTTTLMTGGSRLRRGDRRRGQARARRSRSRPRRWATATSTACRPIRRRCGRSPGWPTIPGRNDFLGVLLGTRRVEQLRPLELARVRRGDRRGRRRNRSRRGVALPTTGPRPSSATRSRSCRSSYGPGWALTRDGLLGCRPERPRHRPDGRAWSGRSDAAPSSAPVPRSSPSLALLASLVPGGGGRRAATFGTPTATSKFGTGHRLQPAGHRRRADRPGRAAADGRGCDRPERRRGPVHAGRRGEHADLHARHQRPAPPDPEHADQGALARLPAVGPGTRRSSARRSRSSTPTTGSTGRPCPGDLVRVHWYEGDAAFGGQGAQARRGRGPRRRRSCSA